MKMILGSYTFDRNPSEVSDLFTPARQVSGVRTYSSIAVFSWGSSLKGKAVDLKWGYLPKTQYDAMQAIYVADAPVSFTPQDGSGKVYQVELMNLTGKFHILLSDAAAWRKDAILSLLFLDEGTTP